MANQTDCSSSCTYTNKNLTYAIINLSPVIIESDTVKVDARTLHDKEDELSILMIW